MYESRFDAVAGTLRLSRAALFGLIRSKGDPSLLDADVAEELRRASVVTAGGALDPRLERAVAALARPLIRLSLEASREAGAIHHHGWIDSHLAVVVSTTSAVVDGGDVVAVPRSLWPSYAARLVSLGPRDTPKVADPVVLAAGLLEAIAAPGQGFGISDLEALLDHEEEVPQPWLELLSSLSSLPVSRWRVGAWWNTEMESPRGRLLEVIDSQAGMVLITHPAQGTRRYRQVRLDPVNPSEVWRLLCTLLPSLDEVAEPLVS